MSRIPINSYDKESVELIVKHRSGDPNAFNDICELHSGLIETVINSEIGTETPKSHHWRKDLRQEISLTLFLAVNHGGYDPSVGPFSSYFFKSAKRRIKRYKNKFGSLISTPQDRKAGRYSSQADMVRRIAVSVGNADEQGDQFYLTPYEDTGIADLIEKEEQSLLMPILDKCLDLLNEKQKDILISVCSGESYASIGRKYKMSREAAQQMYMVSLRSMQIRFQREGYDLKVLENRKSSYKRASQQIKRRSLSA
jgi:RNA polymerase sigma factor (sigma-70 family)